MAAQVTGGARWRNNPSSPASKPHSDRPQSFIHTPQAGSMAMSTHSRSQSFSPVGVPNIAVPSQLRGRSNSIRNSHTSSSTFAPSFIKSEDLQSGSETINGIEGENDFSGKRFLWLRDQETAFIKGFVVEDREDGMLLIQCDDGSVSL